MNDPWSGTGHDGLRPMKDYQIELATEADVDAIVEIAERSFATPWSRQMFLDELRHPDRSRLYVVRARGGEIAAYCSCWHVVDELHINTLAVRRGLRRQGMGAALMRHVLREAARAGARRATLEVRRSNAAALGLYRSFGFVVAGTRPAYYREPVEDAYVLWLEDLGAFAQLESPETLC